MIPGVIGSLQATETLKLILGIGTIPLGMLTCYDGLHSRFRTLKVDRDPLCRLCGEHGVIKSVSNSETNTSNTCHFTQNFMESITTQELRTILESPFQGLLIDVREPDENAIIRIDGSLLIPLKTLPDALATLPRDREILVHCKAGGRSAKAVQLLLDHGFTQVKNVTGGIDAWLAEK